MKQPSLPWEAGCLCAVRFRIRAPAIKTMACHCADCQKLSASASTTIMLPSDAVELTHGETARGERTVAAISSCERCKLAVHDLRAGHRLHERARYHAR